MDIPHWTLTCQAHLIFPGVTWFASVACSLNSDFRVLDKADLVKGLAIRRKFLESSVPDIVTTARSPFQQQMFLVASAIIILYLAFHCAKVCKNVFLMKRQGLGPKKGCLAINLALSKQMISLVRMAPCSPKDCLSQPLGISVRLPWHPCQAALTNQHNGQTHLSQFMNCLTWPALYLLTSTVIWPSSHS